MYAMICLGTSLTVQGSNRFRILFCICWINCLLLNFILFIPYHRYFNPLRAFFQQLLMPALNAFKALRICNVIHDQCRPGILVIRMCERSESLLPSSIPYHKFNLSKAYDYRFRHKGCTNSLAHML